MYLLTNADIRKVRKFTRLLERAIIEIIELKKVRTIDDVARNYYPPGESDFTEEKSFLEYQLKLNFPTNEDF